METSVDDTRNQGSSGVSITSGFYYMRYYCNASVSWGVNRTGVNIGELAYRLPVVSDRFAS